MTRLHKAENTLFWTCAAIFCVFSYFLYDDSLFFSLKNQSQNQNIGTFNVSTNDVRRKSDDSFLWVPVSTTDKVYLRDSIFTGNASRATLNFDDGSTIEIKENSMITLNMNQGQIQLDLRYGDLITALKEKSQIEVTAGEQKFNLKQQNDGPSRVQIQKLRTKRMKVKLLEGNAQFTNKGNNEKISLIKENQLTVSTPGLTKTAAEIIQTPLKPAIHLVTEDKTPVLLLKKGEIFPLRWDAKDLSSFRIEISSKSDFSKKEYSSPANASPHEFKVELGMGWYFWRVIGIDDSETDVVKSEVRRLFVSYLEGPKITSPSPNANLLFESRPPIENFSTDINLSWISKQAFLSFEWQISDTSDFKKIIAFDRATQSSIKSPQLKAGSYFLRVRGFLDEDKVSPWSNPQPWKISVSEKKYSPLELITKNIKFNPMLAKRQPSSIQNPVISWKKHPNAKSYLIETSKTRDFKQKIVFETTTTQWNWLQYNLGTHFFRVFAKGTTEIESPSSDIGTLKVDISNPELTPTPKIVKESEVIGSTAPKVEVPITWTPIPFANKYLLEFDKDSSFKKPIQRQVTSNSETIELPEPGKYHARVIAYQNNQPITNYSNAELIEYEYHAKLAPPKLQEPGNKVNIFLQKDIEPLIWLVWSNDPRSVGYELEISANPEFSKIVMRKKVNESRFLITTRIPLTTIYWRVKALGPKDDSTSGWSETWIFTLMSKTNENFFQ